MGGARALRGRRLFRPERTPARLPIGLSEGVVKNALQGIAPPKSKRKIEEQCKEYVNGVPDPNPSGAFLRKSPVMAKPS